MKNIYELKKHLVHCIAMNRGYMRVCKVLQMVEEYHEADGEIQAYTNCLQWLNEMDEKERSKEHEIEY